MGAESVEHGGAGPTKSRPARKRPQDSAGAKPRCGESFRELTRHIVGHLPPGSSLRKRTIERLASHLGSRLSVVDLNHFLRELQLGIVGSPPERLVLRRTDFGAEVRARAASRLLARAPLLVTIDDSSAEDASELAVAALPSAAPAVAPPQGVAAAAEPATVAVQALCAETRRQRPIAMADGRAHAGNIRHFAMRMLSAAPPASDWGWAWDLAGFASLPAAVGYQAGHLLVHAFLELLSAQAAAAAAPAQAAAAIAVLLRALVLAPRAVEDAVDAFVFDRGSVLDDCPQLREMLSRLLVEVFPRPGACGWGWSRAGWSWQEWWVLAERLLGNVDHESAMLVLRQALAVLKGRGVDSETLRPLQEVLDSCEWAQGASGLSAIDVDGDDAEGEAADAGVR